MAEESTVGQRDQGGDREPEETEKKKRKRKETNQTRPERQAGAASTFEIEIFTDADIKPAPSEDKAHVLPSSVDDNDPGRGESSSRHACWHWFVEGVVITLLVSFNMMAFFSCAVMVAGQIAAMSTLDFRSPELVVLGLTIVLLWILSCLGIIGTCKKHRTMLRMYAFMLLVLILGQMSILFELYKNIDSSFTDQFAGMIKTLCQVTEDIVNLEVPGQAETSSSGLDEFGSGSAASTLLLRGTGLLDQLCGCTELEVPRKCIAQWIASQWRWALVAVVALFGFESICAILAWTYVEEIEEDTIARIKKKQKKTKGALPVWSLAAQSFQAGVGFGEDLHEKARHEAVALTSTWYFEVTVLFACCVMFVVLALQSKTVPPSGDLRVVLSMGEVFVTLFLTVDVLIQVVICMTHAERAKILTGRSPWVTLDILALIASWAHLASDTQWRVFSLGRVLRVLRPMRTLRMLSDINTVLQTIVAALPLFGQACLLITFMLVAYSLICMSLWSGALSFQCERPPERMPEIVSDTITSGPEVSMDVEVLNFVASSSLDENSKHKCPACLDCPAESSELFAVSWCLPLQPPRFIRSEAYGFTGFDSFPQAMLTMFVQMTGDGGMHDVPFALEDAGATLNKFGWTLMMTAVLILTLLALNLFLAVCCSVFDDVHEQVTAKNKRIIERGKGYGIAFADVNGTSEGVLSLMNTISAAAQQTFSSNKQASTNANEALKSTEQKYIDYLNEVRAIQWQERSRIGACRNCSQKVVLSRPFRIFVDLMVTMNAVVLMSNHHGMSPKWRALNLALETACLLFFWIEFIMKMLGFGRRLYFRSNTHRLDAFVLVCCSAGWAGNALSLASELLPMIFPGYELFSRGLHAFSSIRLVRLLRALQMSRWIYSHRKMRELIEAVFKSWQSILLIGIFTFFSLTMFAIMSMHLLGGSLGPAATIEDYPRRNVETFSRAFSVSFQYLTGESWSEIMYWYMQHADIHWYGVAFYMVVQFVWMRCLLFSLFVAVLLVNFAVDEDDKMPRQRIKFDREEAAARKAGHKAGSTILRALNMESMEGMGEKKVVPTPLEVLEAYNMAMPTSQQEGEEKDYTRRACMVFDTAHPFRLLCAKVESHPLFDSVVMYMILFGCFIIAFESPDMKAQYSMYFDLFNLVLLCLFYIEMLIKMVVHGAFRTSGPTLPYIRDPLNRLDLFVLIVISCTYVLPMGGIGDVGAAGRVMRLVRVMTPMLELMRNHTLRGLVNTFALSLPAVGAIMTLLSILLAVFGIIGVEYFGGRLYRCVYLSDTYSVVPFDEVTNRTQCESRDDTLWANPAWNFDNIFSAGVTLFYICINSSWLEIMESTLDITDIDQAPVQNSSPHFWIYFMCFHITFSFFLLNLFIGVLSSAFSAQSGQNLITTLQRRWIRVLALLKSFTPEDSAIDRPDVGVKLWKIRGRCWDWAENQRVENLWTAGILLNVILLIVDHYPASAEWEWFMATMNFGCLLLFTAEVIIKMLAYSPHGFLSDGWHQMDLLVVIGSWFSKAFGVKAGVGVVRAFRTVRLVLLVKRMPGLMSLMNTVIACIGPAASIAAISFLAFYLYAVIGMKLYGGASTEMRFYNDQNNFDTFFSTMRLLFQLINGQDMKSMINDLQTLEFGWVIPFAYLATFFFLCVFICMNLFIVTVLDNFANLCSMDDVRITTEDLDTFSTIWHKLTYEKIWAVDSSEVGIEISDDMLQNMENDEIEQLFEQKYERESDLRLRNWADFKRSFPLAPYIAEHDPVFSGWLHRPNTLANVTGGLLKVNDLRYFWVDGAVKEPLADGHLCLNWFSDGGTERELDYRSSKGTLLINRVQIKTVKTPLPPVKLSRQKTAADVSREMGALRSDGRINKMSAAMSGRTWLVAIANAQANHQQNAMAMAFSLAYFEKVLGDPATEANNIPPSSPRVKQMQDKEGLTPLQSRLRFCIQLGVTIPSTTTGMYACTSDDYTDFWPMFSRVIARVHGLGSQYAYPDPECWPGEENDADDVDTVVGFERTRVGPEEVESNDTAEDNVVDKQPMQHGVALVGAHSFGPRGWDIKTVDAERVPEVLTDRGLDLACLTPSMPPIPIRLSAARNLQAFNLVASMKQDERTTVEDLLGHTIAMLIERPEWRGRYVSLTPGHLNEIQQSEHEVLAEEGLMFPSALNYAEMEASGLTTDWPYGRGCWISQDERTTIWIGYEDHIVVNAGGNSETDVDILLDELKVMLDIVEDTDGVEYRFDPERCGFITSSVKRVGTGMAASAKIKLPKLTIDGSTDRIREIIDEKQLDMRIVEKQKEIAPAFQKFSSATLLSSDDVESGGEVHIEVKRTYAVSEANIAASLYTVLKAIWEAEQEEHVFLGSFADTTIGHYIARACGQAQRQKKLAVKLADAVEERTRLIAEEATRLAEEQAVKVQEMALAAAQEAQAVAREVEKAAAAGIEKGKQAAQDAQALALAGIEAVENVNLTEVGKLDSSKSSLEGGAHDLASGLASNLGGALSIGTGAIGEMSDMFDGLGEAGLEFLKLTDPLAIELEVIPIDAPSLHFKNAQEIELETITQAVPSETTTTTPDGVERYGVQLTVFDELGQNTMGVDTKAGRVKKGGPVEEHFEFLLPTEETRNEWLAAVRAAMPEVAGSVYTGEAKQGIIHMQNSRHKWKARHCTLSSSGFVTSDNMDGSISMRLVAQSSEEKDAWIVAMKWLERNCEGPPPRKDPRMYPGGIPPRPLNSFEYQRLNSRIGLLDLPLSSMRPVLELLQQDGKLAVTKAHARDYVFYCTFQMELHAYQTAASDRMQRLSGIETAVQAIDGLNFMKTLTQLCLVNLGKLNCLTYRDQVENFEMECEFVAVRIIQAAVGGWVALRAQEKWGDDSDAAATEEGIGIGGEGGRARRGTPHPAHPFWRRMPNTYRVGVLAMRDIRLRNLGLLAKIIRRQRPLVKLAEYLKRENEYSAKGPSNGNAQRDVDIFDEDDAFHNPLAS